MPVDKIAVIDVKLPPKLVTICLRLSCLKRLTRQIMRFAQRLLYFVLISPSLAAIQPLL